MACRIERDKPVLVIRGDHAHLKWDYHQWLEISANTKTHFVIFETIAGRVIFSNTELIFGEYEPEIDPLILNRQLRERVKDYSSLQIAVLQDPIFN